MDNISDSENPNSSPSISLPSEPPDIRNWFSSYQYESSVLDTYDPIGGSLFQESDLDEDRLDVAGDRNGEKKRNLDKLGRNSEIDVNRDEHPFVEMPDSTCLQSILSEPPHIRNWFPSYEYESPELNAADDFEKSVSKNSGTCEESLDFKETREKTVGCFGTQRNFLKNDIVDAVDNVLCPNKLLKCTNSFEDTCAHIPASEIPDSSHIPSTLSEPLDIGNWFSSYVYKSPESGDFSDTEVEGVEDCIVNQLKREKERNSREVGQTRITTKVVIEEKANSNEVLRLTSSSRNHDEQQSQSVDRQEKENDLVKDDLASSQSKNRVSKRKLILNEDVSENSEIKVQREADVPPAGSREPEMKCCGINGKENEVTVNGFVTTKNRPRPNNENSLSWPKSGLQRCSDKEGAALPSCGKKATERRVLWERTNMEEAEAPGITGKWQCPQKRKPKLGPPLKQLRLERWINKL